VKPFFDEVLLCDLGCNLDRGDLGTVSKSRGINMEGSTGRKIGRFVYVGISSVRGLSRNWAGLGVHCHRAENKSSYEDERKESHLSQVY
jgi:hypothetical protein